MYSGACSLKCINSTSCSDFDQDIPCHTELSFPNSPDLPLLRKAMYFTSLSSEGTLSCSAQTRQVSSGMRHHRMCLIPSNTTSSTHAHSLLQFQVHFCPVGTCQITLLSAPAQEPPRGGSCRRYLSDCRIAFMKQVFPRFRRPVAQRAVVLPQNENRQVKERFMTGPPLPPSRVMTVDQHRTEQ